MYLRRAMFRRPDVSYSIVIISAVFILGNWFKQAKAGLSLNEYIDHFEPLFYDHFYLRDRHRRATSSPSMDQHFTLEFAAHNRLFHLRLKRDTTVFAEDSKFESTKTTVHYDKARALTGYLEDEEDSSVEAVVTDSGLLDGVVKVSGEEFYIEPAKNYLHPPQQFHSVIYRLSDVKFPMGNLTCLSHRIQPPTSVDSTAIQSSTQRPSHKFHRWSGESSRNHKSTSAETPHTKRSHKHRSQKLHHHIKNLYKDTIGKTSWKTSEQSLNEQSENVLDLKRTLRTRKAVKLHHQYHRTKSKASLLLNFVNKDMYSDSGVSANMEFNNNRFQQRFTNINKYSSKEMAIPNIDQSKDYGVKDHPLDVISRDKDYSNDITSSNEKVHQSSKVITPRDELQPVITPSSAYSDHLSSAEVLKKRHQVQDPALVRDKNLSFHADSSLILHKFENFSLGNHDATPRTWYSNDFEEDSTVSCTFPNIASQSPKGGELFRDLDEDVPYWRELDALHYTEDGRTGSSEPYGVRSIQRTQWSEDRGQRHVAVDRRKSTCLLYLQADHLFYRRMGSEEACIEAMTRHVQRVNSIYRSTDFDQDGRPDNISFLIKRIKVHTSPDDTDYRFVGNYGVEKFLELFSEDDYDAFCLAYMFTYRDFEGGTLGLAWTGDLKNAGGVCEKNGHYRGSLKSLNTGIITLLNYGKHVPPVVSHVTLAHEIGHNFGSPHDPEDDQHCTPGGEHGNYIMFARATSGDKKNNNKFSPCSLRSINAVLNTKARSVKGCFTEPLDAVCGNEVVEGAEECDCGWEEDCHEPCCFPMRVNPPQDQPPCRLRPAAFCSPSQGPCCSHDCRLKYGILCREDNGCRTASYCDGQGPQCPSSTKKPNKTVCSEEFVCYNGECTGSICMAYGLESCQCVRNFHDPLIRSCELCCKLPGDELSCKSSYEWNVAPYDVPDLYAKPGAPCDNYNGYCDVYQYCREIDPSGPLATLRKLLLSPEGAVILKRWIAEKWWGILLLFVAVAFTVTISVRLLSRRNSKSFLSTILPHQGDFRLCHSRSSPRSQPSYLATSSSGTSNRVTRPRISSAPENGWV